MSLKDELMRELSLEEEKKSINKESIKKESNLLKPKGEQYTWDEFISLAEREPVEAVKLIINAMVTSDSILDRTEIRPIVSDQNKDLYRSDEWIGDIYPRTVTYNKTSETTKMYTINLYSNRCAVWARGEMDIENAWPNIFPKGSTSKSMKRCMCFIFHVLMHIAFIVLFESGKDISTTKECISISRHLYNLMGMDYDDEISKTFATAGISFIINDLIKLNISKEEK